MVACETALLTKLPSLCDKQSISSQCFIIKACLRFAFNVKELTQTKALIKRGNVESDRSQKDRRCVPKQPPHFSKKTPQKHSNLQRTTQIIGSKIPTRECERECRRPADHNRRVCAQVQVFLCENCRPSYYVTVTRACMLVLLLSSSSILHNRFCGFGSKLCVINFLSYICMTH